MFKGFFSSKGKINKPEYIPVETDYSFDNPAAANAAQLLQEKNYSELIEYYANASTADKSLILDKCCLTDKYSSYIETWSLQSHQAFYSNIFHAVYLTYKAWQARTAAYANELSDDQANAFAEYLQEAFDLLSECIEIDCKQPEVFARLIRICMGWGDKENAQACFDNLMQLDEGHVHGHMFMYNLLTPKWLGSVNEINDFSEWVAEKRQKYPLLIIINLMHFAELYNIWSDTREKYARKRCRQEILSMVKDYYKWIQNVDLHPQFKNYISNYFAFLFHVCDENEAMIKEINVLNPNIPLYPWGYIGIADSNEFWLHKW